MIYDKHYNVSVAPQIALQKVYVLVVIVIIIT